MTVFREQVVGVGCDGAVRKDIIIGVCRNDPELKRWGNAQEVSAGKLGQVHQPRQLTPSRWTA